MQLHHHHRYELGRAEHRAELARAARIARLLVGVDPCRRERRRAVRRRDAGAPAS